MAATTSSGFWGNDVNAYSLLDGKMPRLDRVRRIVNRDGYRVTKALLDALIGATSGGAASGSHSRVANPVNSALDVFGAAAVTSVTDISRNTTAADVTALKEFLVNVSVRPAFPRDLSGNGGPALA